MALRYLHPDLFAYDEAFLSASQHVELLAFLRSVRTVTPEERARATVFTLAPPVAGATIVEGRLEGAAGWPVWTAQGPATGVAIPAPLAKLAALLDGWLADQGLWQRAGAEPAVFTSVYVDRYPPDGTFVAHTDRACYGVVVAGVSVGPGSCVLHFDAAAGESFGYVLAPGSLYVFAGMLRRPPCTHRVDSVSDERFAVTFRSPAPSALGTA